MTMPADPDLDALDALLQAATPGPFYVAQDPEFPSLRAIYVGGPDGDLWASALLPEDAEAFAAAVNALPALLRRARIGDAAREVLEAEAAERYAATVLQCTPRTSPKAHAKAKDAMGKAQAVANAARARYRALKEETPDA